MSKPDVRRDSGGLSSGRGSWISTRRGRRWKEEDPGLPPDIADLFPDRFVESELGEIPEGWNVLPLDEIADFRNGLALQRFRPEDNEEWLPVLKIAQLRRGSTERC